MSNFNIKVLQINSTSNWGSTGVIAEEIGKLVLLKGGISHIAYGRYCRESKSKSIKIGNSFFVLVHYLFSRIFDAHGLISVIPTLIFLRKIKHINPDIIHLHNIHGYYLNYKILFWFLKRFQRPIVWTLHDCWAYTGHCSFYTSKSCTKWMDKCGRCPNRNEYPCSLLDFSSFNYMMKSKSFIGVDNLHIVVVSKWLLKEVKHSFLKEYNSCVIHNGVDTDVFKPYMSEKKNICKEDQTLILGVANSWDNRKGLNDFIKLSQMLDDNYHIHLIGLSEEQISLLPKQNNLTAITRTNDAYELAKLYSSSDVYVNMSLEETLGMTNIESLSCGTPIIVYNTTACPEAVGDGCGYVVEVSSLTAIVEILNKYIRGRKNLYIDNCRNYAVSNFSKKEKYEEYIRLYKQLLK